MVLITINGNTLDTSATSPQEATIRANVSASASTEANSNYILLTTNSPLTKAQKQTLTSNNVHLKEYVAENTYVCRYEPTDLSPVRALDFIAYTDIYPTTFVINPSLRTNTTTGGPPAHISARLHTVDIILHKDCAFSGCKRAICAAAHVDPEDVTGCKGKVRLTVQEQFLEALAAVDDVAVIQEVPTNRLFNDVARGILEVDDVSVGGTVYDGTGQIIAVGDTGVDSAHPAFAGEGRIVKLMGLGRSGRTNDPDGHGTHVCGSVLGNSTLEDGTPIQGSAPGAKLVMQSLLDAQGGLGGIPADLADLFGPAYAEGSRVHNNSWGSSTPGLPYDQSAREIDEFVVDNPDMVICFAAGNDGIDRDSNGVIDPRQIGSQAAAKNCITVGASENNRPDLTVTYSSATSRDPRFPTTPIFGDRYADNPDGLAAFSSRGPTRERRIKPDVVAPGTCILSARSSLAGMTTFYGVSPDERYMYESGTSMACPLVSGCAGVVRGFLVANPPPPPPAAGGIGQGGVVEGGRGGGQGGQRPIVGRPGSGVGQDGGSGYSPSAALVKALLINGAVELVGQYNPSEAGPSPNPNSGWGRVSVASSAVVPSATAGYGENVEGIDEDDKFSFAIDVPAAPGGGGQKTLKVTLVWTDPAGAQLQSDLDLVVRLDGESGSQERHGNMGSGAGFDRLNNVEQVKWEGLAAGSRVVVEVRVHRLTGERQGFAWAWKLE